MNAIPPSPNPPQPTPVADPLPASPPPASPRRRRGAQPGNKNALKHGYYAGRFKRTDLKAYSSYRFAGLTEEIALLRLFIRRIVDLGVEDQHFPQSVNLLRAISLAVVSLDRLVKTQAHLIDGEDDISIAIREVFAELTGGDPSPAPPPRQSGPAEAGGAPRHSETALPGGMDCKNENEPADPTGPFQAYALTYNIDPDDRST